MIFVSVRLFFIVDSALFNSLLIVAWLGFTRAIALFFSTIIKSKNLNTDYLEEE